jgi:hypothetical protein
MIHPYPLQWPDHQRRSARREQSRFRTTLAAALANVENSLRLFAQDSGRQATAVSITSNVAGLSNAQPADTGVAVWFLWDGEQRCIAVDRYQKVAENLQAIHHVIEARRTELRHAGIEMVRTTFRGLTALPPPPAATAIPKESWWQVLGLRANASPEVIQTAYKTLVRAAPDDETRKRLNIARDEGVHANG